VLGRFDRFLAKRASAPPLEANTVRDYLASLIHLSPRTRENVVSVVWQVLSYAGRHGAPVERLPERPPSPSSRNRLREPFVLSLDQVNRLLLGARQLSPTRSACHSTYETLFGLLYVTGVRIDEALSLDDGDLDRAEGLLTIRRGKFRKVRILPLRPSTVAALARYLDQPGRALSRAADTPLFVSCRRRRLCYTAARQSLLRAARLGGVRDACGRAPRLHDLRFTFAVHRLVAWYREGRDVNALLPALSTYMGHTSVDHTLVYLRAAKLLLAEAGRRFEVAANAFLEGSSA
jgi:integrase